MCITKKVLIFLLSIHVHQSFQIIHQSHHQTHQNIKIEELYQNAVDFSKKQIEYKRNCLYLKLPLIRTHVHVHVI